MPAYFESGFSVREPMWHDKDGKHTKDRYPKDWNEAREWAGLTWEPIEAPAFGFVGKRADGSPTYDPADAVEGMYVPESNKKRIIRNDTGATLGHVGGTTGDDEKASTGYALIDHVELGNIVEALLDTSNNVKYETTIVMHEGRQIAVLAYLDEPITLPGDNSPTFPFLAVTTRHDGAGAAKALPTSIRIVCANTCSAAEAEGDRHGTAFTFSHTQGWRDRVEEAKRTIHGLRSEFDKYVVIAESLLGIRVTAEQKEQFITAFIPSPPEGLVTDRVMNNVNQARDMIRTILASPTSDGPVGDTAWGLVQAAGEYLDHYRSYRSLDSYYKRQLLRPEPLKGKAVALVREVVGMS